MRKFYVARVSYEPCYCERVLYRSYSIDNCRAYMAGLVDAEDCYIFNAEGEIVEDEDPSAINISLDFFRNFRQSNFKGGLNLMELHNVRLDPPGIPY